MTSARSLRGAAAIGLAAALSAGCVKASATEQAMALSRQHQEERAIDVLRRRLAERPDDLPARRLLVRLLGVTGDLGAARREVDELERRVPEGDPVPWIELGHAYELAHRFEDALAAYDDAANVAKASPLGPREGGMRCARWGEVDEARPRLEEAVRRGARDAELWHALGLVRLHQRDLAAAEEAYRAGIAQDPDGVENVLGLATVAVVRGDAAGALAAYGAILARRPRYAPAEVGRAWAYGKLGRAEDALRALDRAERLGAAPASLARARALLRAAPPASRPSPPPPTSAPPESPSVSPVTAPPASPPPDAPP